MKKKIYKEKQVWLRRCPKCEKTHKVIENSRPFVKRICENCKK